MRKAAVWLQSWRLVWVDAGKHEITSLQPVTVRLGDGEESGVVYVAPEQWVQEPVSIEGTIVAVHPFPLVDDDRFPGVDLPHLGKRVVTSLVSGTIIGVDVLGRTVTVGPEAGEPVTVDVESLRSDAE